MAGALERRSLQRPRQSTHCCWLTDTLCCAAQVEPTLINIAPQLIDVAPKGLIAEAVGIAVEPKLIDVSPGGRSDSFIP